LKNLLNYFFCDPPSAANHIRVALENLLTHLKVKRLNVGKGKKSFIPLHNRIELLPKPRAFKDLLFAIKWLGNAGSHTNVITIDDCLDDYEIMEEVLRLLYDSKGNKIKQLARKINKKKGPVT